MLPLVESMRVLSRRQAPVGHRVASSCAAPGGPSRCRPGSRTRASPRPRRPASRGATRRRRTIGVLPTASTTDSIRRRAANGHDRVPAARATRARARAGRRARPARAPRGRIVEDGESASARRSSHLVGPGRDLDGDARVDGARRPPPATPSGPGGRRRPRPRGSARPPRRRARRRGTSTDARSMRACPSAPTRAATAARAAAASRRVSRPRWPGRC